jgi:hypothetical protein
MRRYRFMTGYRLHFIDARDRQDALQAIRWELRPDATTWAVIQATLHDIEAAREFQVSSRGDAAEEITLG